MKSFPGAAVNVKTSTPQQDCNRSPTIHPHLTHSKGLSVSLCRDPNPKFHRDFKLYSVILQRYQQERNLSTLFYCYKARKFMGSFALPFNLYNCFIIFRMKSLRYTYDTIASCSKRLKILRLMMTTRVEQKVVSLLPNRFVLVLYKKTTPEVY